MACSLQAGVPRCQLPVGRPRSGDRRCSALRHSAEPQLQTVVLRRSSPQLAELAWPNAALQGWPGISFADQR